MNIVFKCIYVNMHQKQMFRTSQKVMLVGPATWWAAGSQSEVFSALFQSWAETQAHGGLGRPAMEGIIRPLRTGGGVGRGVGQGSGWGTHRSRRGASPSAAGPPPRGASAPEGQQGFKERVINNVGNQVGRCDDGTLHNKKSPAHPFM